MVDSGGGRPARDSSRLLVGVCVAAGAAYMQGETISYIITPMLVTFGEDQDSGAVLREMPSIASLSVIFISALLAARFGARRIITVGALLLTIGSALVAAAPGVTAATIGLAVQSVGGTILLVVPLGAIGAAFVERDARTRAIALFSMVSPLVFVLLPVLTAALMEAWTWRVVAGTWVVGGLVALLAGRWALLGPQPEQRGGEWWTPALAGLACVGIVQAISHASSDGVLAPATLVRVVVAVGAIIALLVVLRRTERPSLDVAILRRPGVVLLLVVIVLWCFIQLWYYMTLTFEYVYGRSVLQTALLMVPAQVCAAIGARTASPIVQRWGLTAPGVVLLLVSGGALALTATFQVDSPLWWPLAVTCVYSYAAVAAGVPITNALMNAATVGDEGGASAYRQAAISIGSVTGIALFSAVVYAAFTASVTQQLDAAAISVAEATPIAQQLRAGASVQQVSDAYSVPVSDVRTVGQSIQRAALDGIGAQGWVAAGICVASAGLYLVSRRRAAQLAPSV